jgi:hypothetical protein
MAQEKIDLAFGWRGASTLCSELSISQTWHGASCAFCLASAMNLDNAINPGWPTELSIASTEGATNGVRLAA